MSDEAYTGRVIEHLIDIEEVAEDILTDKQQLIDLDRRRQKTREAVRAINKEKKIKKTWVCFGNMFLKLEKTQTKKILDKGTQKNSFYEMVLLSTQNIDFDQLDEEIDKIRKGLKPKVNRLRDLEHEEDMKGFNLNPLSKDEMKMIESL